MFIYISASSSPVPCEPALGVSTPPMSSPPLASSCASVPAWQVGGRSRRCGAARRAQAMRAQARAVQRLLQGFLVLQRHRGCAPSRLGRALASALLGEEPKAEDTVAEGVAHGGPKAAALGDAMDIDAVSEAEVEAPFVQRQPGGARPAGLTRGSKRRPRQRSSAGAAGARMSLRMSVWRAWSRQYGSCSWLGAR